MAITIETQSNFANRVYGWVIAIASILSVAAMVKHPAPTGEIRSVIQEILEKGRLTAYVHASLMITMGALLFGFYGFSAILRNRLLAQAGLVAYAIGTFAMFSAMTSSGFVSQGVAGYYARLSPDEAQTITGLLRMSSTYTQAWAHIATAATSLAILFWSLSFIKEQGSQRFLGWFGVAAGAIPGFLSTTGIMPLDVRGMLAVILAQTLWNVTVGVQLIRGKIE